MAINDRYTASNDGLANGSDFNVTASGTGTGVVELQELAGTGDCDVFLEIDQGQTGTFEVSVKIGSATDDVYDTSGNWRIQEPAHWIGNDGSNNEVRIRVNNTSGGTIDVAAIGYEAGT